MKPKDSARKLKPRDRAILRDVIGTYILTGSPVSSRAIAKSRRHGLSAASIRNIMADLEDLGYLSHPHVSAGRVPTGDGYHLYIDDLMPSQAISERVRTAIEEGLGDQEGDGERLASSASHLLSELSRQIGIVVTPSIDETVIRSVNFVSLSGSKVLCVVVSSSGFVDHKVIEAPLPTSQDELTKISNYLNDRFGGETIRAVRRRLLAMMAEERAKVNRLLATAIDLADRALPDGHPELHFDGAASLLAQPELADLERVRALLDTFENKAALVRLLNQLIEGPGVRVVIGEESDLTSKLDFSLVLTTYGVGETQGALAVFGPSRMEYHKMIPLVDYLGERLSQALEGIDEQGTGGATH
ncbi:MAG: heat-inducible transcriptional repressor HrcA [Thermoanaerobaculia bacterium]|nr:heat-inducible transcriptional repressor HrcA [Thermoanaerobaculia bacterium]